MLRITPLLLCLTTTFPVFADSSTLTTHSERSGFIQTGRYQEVIELCESFAKQYPEAVRCFNFGTTPEGRPMKALAVSYTGFLTPEQANLNNIPVVLIQGGIHAGEIEGKDGGFLALQQLLKRPKTEANHPLNHLVWVFVPVFNADGHERFGAWNRPNQRGPEEMGWRVTAQNFNLNRDYIKTDSPEMQAMLNLFNAWDPLLYVDLHATDGAQFEHDISVQVEPVIAGDSGLKVAGRQLRDNVLADLARQGSMPLPYYPSLVEDDNPESGFSDDVSTPRFSHGYFWLRNRFGMLVETHSWKEYPVRVKLMRNTIDSVLNQIAEHGKNWQQLALQADKTAAGIAGQSVPLEYQPTDKTTMVDFKGYAYTRTMSDISGALMTKYDETTPQIWHVPLRNDIQPSIQANAPLAGYIIPAAYSEKMAEKLAIHGISYSVIENPSKLPVEVFQATETQFAKQSVESHQRISLKGDWHKTEQNIKAGSLFVPITQAKSRLIMSIFEPVAPDSLVQWGFFNNIFERKEYMEDYVAEEVARKMLAENPALKQQFEQKLKDDPAFAANPKARLDYFYKLHSAWDKQFNQYPIMRVDQVPNK